MNASKFALAAGVLLVVFANVVTAGVYRCTDPKTKAVTYSGTPCTSGDQAKVPITSNAILDGSRVSRNAQGQPERAMGDQSNSKLASQAPQQSNSEDRAMRDRLASECSRGFNQSCSALRALNSGQNRSSNQDRGGDSDMAKRLAQECERGFQKSCIALRALNGEQESKRAICMSTGSTESWGGTGSYNGVTICR